ncbi:MAG: LysR family transcriptional regulator [Pseudomonadota bacterium]
MIPRLGTHHLAVLVALAETGTATAAAARLGLTQSAVSHRLREAERRLDLPLARRAEGRLFLTPEGERLRELAARFLGDLARLERSLEAEREGGRRLVRLGQATYSRFHWLPAFLDNLAQTEPQLTVDLSGRATQRPFEALREGAVDVSTVYGRPAATSPFRWIRLGADPLVAVMSPDHPLAGRPWIDGSNFGEARLYTYPLTVEPGFEWEALLGPPAAPLRRITPLATPEAAIDLLRAGYGVALFSRWAIAPELADGTLTARPYGPDGMSLDWWAVLRADEPEDSPAERLAAALVAWAARHERPLATLGFETDPDA